MRFTVPAIVSMMAAVLLTGCSLFAEGPDQDERDSWSRVIEASIEALPGVGDASHTFRYNPYGPNSYYTSELDVQLEDDATPAETAAVVRVMGAQQLPPHYRGEQTLVEIRRMADSYFGSWLFGRDVDVEANAAYAWTRVSSAGTGAQIHWSGGIRANGAADGPLGSIGVRAGSEGEPQRATAAMRRISQEFPELAANNWTVSPTHGGSMSELYSRLGRSVTHVGGRPRFPSHGELEVWEWLLTDQPTPFVAEVSVFDPPATAGRTLGVTLFPPVGAGFSAVQTTQLADRHLHYLSLRGGVVDYTIINREGPDLAVLVGGCPATGREVSPESEPFARQYERC
ncbi:hypothetical protein QX204_17900 [Nocardia sp. PE-7]|uniref:hypothetical protein n=1 Tax=Nocardia sp. PE-7 TaxID=3058426 RepID=UPI00265A50C4|nr:hypothetical protein [Nocardia sp. PE-7]WKG06993.1 hypothetical protein QX204_17900 [Nocardia sp. PE-7]